MKKVEGYVETEFKETEIGLIPKDWEVAKVSDVATTKSGGTPSRKHPEYYSGDIAWVKSGELEDSFIFQTEENVTAEGVQNSSAKLFPVGTLLVAMYGATVGRTAILGIEATTNQAVCAIFPEKDKVLSNYLMYQFIARRDELLKERYGGAQPNISQRIIRDFFIALPPLLEQHRIAAILSAIQEEIAVQDDLIAEAQEFKRSLMQRLFTYGAGDEPSETKETEIGEIPVHWKTKPVGEIAELQYGYQTSIPKTPPPNGIDIISTAEVKNEGYLDISKIRKVEIEQRKIEKYLVAKNDILFNWRNSQEHVGKTALVEFNPVESMIYASFIVRIRPVKSVSYAYIHHLLTFLRDRGIFFTLSRRAVNQANFNANQLSELEIPVPTLQEQERIAYLLSDLDQKIAAEQDRKAALQELFKSMLHQLMIGHIRLLSDEGLPV